MAKKPRNKTYRPKRVAANKALLTRLPISPDIAKSLTSKMLAGLMHMRMAEKNVHDLLAAVVYFGTVWMASDRMDETDALRNIFGRAIIALEDDLKADGPLAAETLDICTDAAQLGRQVLMHLTTIEFVEISTTLKKDGVLPIVDAALEEISVHREQGRLAERGAAEI